MCRVLVVVLNYHTNNDVKKLLKSMMNLDDKLEYDVFIGNTQPRKDEIIEIKNYIENINMPNYIKVNSLILNENMGYARGNNYIIRQAVKGKQKTKYNYVLIANPDIVINDRNVVTQLIKIMDEKEDVAVVGPKVLQMGQKQQGPYKFNNPILDSIKFFCPPIGFLMKAFSDKWAEKIKTPTYVWRLIGCFMLVDYDIFESVGFFDEDTFLYGEENLLSFKFNKINKKSIYVPSVSVIHNHPFKSEYYEGKSLECFIESNKILLKKMGYSDFIINIKIASIKFYVSLRRILKNIKSFGENK